MSSFSELRVLVAQLCGLDEIDAQLPLEILVNLHRPQLRTPFEGLLRFAVQFDPLDQFSGDQVVEDLENELDKRYPGLESGKLFLNDFRLRDFVDKIDMPPVGFGYPQWLERSVVVSSMLEGQEDGWYNWDAVLRLHQLTWKLETATRFERCAAASERQLELSPEVARMILDMSKL